MGLKPVTARRGGQRVRAARCEVLGVNARGTCGLGAGGCAAAVAAMAYGRQASGLAHGLVAGRQPVYPDGPESGRPHTEWDR
jgi:hypothetical protein